MLNTQAQKLCENIDVTWMTPTCDADSNERKRSRYLSVAQVKLQKHFTIILGYDSDFMTYCKTNLRLLRFSQCSSCYCYTLGK